MVVVDWEIFRTAPARRWWRSISLALAVVIGCYGLVGAGRAQDIRTGPLPPSIASAGVTQAEWDAVRAAVRHEAQRAGVAEAALLAAAERAGVNLAGSGRYDAASLRDAITGQLQTQAQIIAELEDRLAVLAQADDPQIAQLLNDARIAIGEGRLDEADRLLAEAENSDIAAIAVAEARAERARGRIADAIAERGKLERSQGGAAAAGVRDAITAYEQQLRSVDRMLAPRDWARLQLNLGIAYAILAQDGNDGAYALSVQALRAAVSGFEILQDTAQVTRARRLIAALETR